jgi:hypothetical protein
VASVVKKITFHRGNICKNHYHSMKKFLLLDPANLAWVKHQEKQHANELQSTADMKALRAGAKVSRAAAGYQTQKSIRQRTSDDHENSQNNDHFFFATKMFINFIDTLITLTIPPIVFIL